MIDIMMPYLARRKTFSTTFSLFSRSVRGQLFRAGLDSCGSHPQTSNLPKLLSKLVFEIL